MKAYDLIPSWLTTWVAWRDHFTNKGSKPFHLLSEILETDEMPSSGSFYASAGNECPYCNGDKIINSKEYGVVYCICHLLPKIEQIREDHRGIATKVGEGSFDDIVYPEIMGTRYIDNMQELVWGAKDFIERPDHWMLIRGVVGTGKTHILKAINTAFDPMALYISAGNVEQLTHKYRKEDTLGDFYNILSNAPILIIDDLGMEYGGKLVQSGIEKIIDIRYERWPDGPTIIATNMTIKQVREYIMRASDRILDEERTKIFNIDSNKSFRGLTPEKRS